MKVASVVLLLAALLSVAFGGSDNTGTISGGITLSATQNVSNAGTSGDYRVVTMGTFVETAYYVSIEVDESSSTSNGETTVDASADGIVALVMIDAGYPLSVSMYFYESAHATVSGGLASITGAGTGSVAALAYLSVDEVDASGNVVATTQLNALTFGLPATSSQNFVHTAVWTATASSYTVQLAAVASEISGILVTGGAPITPKTVETIIEFESIQYKTSGNHLRLNVLSATASASSSFGGTASTLVSGSGPSQVFVHFAGQAVVDGNTADVTVNGVATAGTGNSHKSSVPVVEAFLSVNSSLTADYRVVTIDFPADATHVSYDPAVGFDATLYSGASALVAPVALVFFAAFLLVLL